MATAPLLPPEDQETLRKLIVGAFPGPNGVTNLDFVLQPALGYSLFDELAGAGTPMGQVARALIAQAEGDGSTSALVQALFVARPGDTPLREWVRRCRPDLMSLVPEAAHTQAVVASATEGVEVLRQVAAARPEVRARLDAAHLDLGKLPREINRMALYKGLHDVLHNVQVPLYRSIVEDLRSAPTVSGCADSLSIYADQLAQLAQGARDVLAGGGLEEGEHATETGWIEQLATLATGLAAAAAADDRAAAVLQQLGLKSILRAHPPRLDAMLVAAARAMPFKSLVDTMAVVGLSLPDGSDQRLQLGKAVAALNQIKVDVTARVSEHESWQAIEVSFWATEDAIRRNDADSIAEFQAYWAVLEQQVGKICVSSPGEWVADLQTWSTTFRTLCPEPVVPPVHDEAQRAFFRYVNAGRQRFFLIDKELKQRCDKVTGLSQPLSELIQGTRP